MSNKEVITKEISDRIEQLERLYSFDNSNGWQQVDKKGQVLNRLFGEYTAYISMYEYLTNGSTWITVK